MAIFRFKKKINLSTSLAGQAVGIKEIDDGIWLVSFMNYDLGYIDLEEKTLQPLQNPFGSKVSGTICNLCVQAGPFYDSRVRGIRTIDRLELHQEVIALIKRPRSERIKAKTKWAVDHCVCIRSR